MFGYDPIDFFDPAPYGALPYYGHYLVGSIALLAALVAFSVRKGKGTHRLAGLTYMASCLIVCVTSAAMLAVNFIPPLALAVFTAIYAIGGAYLALQPGTARVKAGEYALTAFEIVGVAIFLTFAIPEALSGRIPPAAPLIVGSVPLILLMGDAYWFTHSHRRKQLRIARHLARMVWAFIVVLRAPLVEIAAAGAPIPAPVAIFGPLILGAGMLWYFQRKYGGLPFGEQP